MVLSVAVNLGMLGYFKYTNFLIDISNQLFGQGFLQFQNIFLPVGISFFVFQSMSYTIDIYRGQLKPLSNWLDYLFYLSFFPQLVAGPIVRARDFIPQIRQNPVVVTREMFGTGVFLILTGLFKRRSSPDYISLNFVDRIFDEPLLYSGLRVPDGHLRLCAANLLRLLGLFGHGHRHRPAAGLPLPEELRRPVQVGDDHRVLAAVAHLALDVAARLPLYLAGRQPQGPPPDLRNLLVTMLLGGLWHGAAVRFILWGGLHGAALALHKLWMAVVPGAKAWGADALVEPCGGHPRDVQPGLLGLADVPRRVNADGLADAAPDLPRTSTPR